MSRLSVESAVKAFVDEIPSGTQIVIGLSGGLDSVVLTHALSQMTDSNRLKAVYIHHGLHASADEWQSFCQNFCQNLGIEFHSQRISVTDTQRQGIEAIARKERYQALSGFLSQNTLLVTAHHQRDQAETVLLNLFRGAGVKGLAAMPVVKKMKISSQLHYRPLLRVAYQTINDYALLNKLEWVEDPSNLSLDYRRNGIRHQILPMVEAQWPEVSRTLARVSSHMSETAELLNVLAEQDMLDAQVTSFSLDLTKVRQLSWSRQKNLIRFWCERYLSGCALNNALYDWLEEVLDHENPNAHPSRRLSNIEEFRVENHKIYFFKDFKTVFSEPWCGQSLSHHYFDEVDLLRHEINSKWLNGVHSVTVRSINKDDVKAFPNLMRWLKMNEVVYWNRSRWPVLEVENKLAAILGFITIDKYK